MSEESPEQVVPVERDWHSEATGMGWNAEYEGPDKLDAREFVLRKPLYDEMKKLRKKAKELETAVRTQAQIHEQMQQREKQDLLNNLKAQKVQAIEEADAAKVVQLDEEIEKVRSTPVKTQQGPPPEFIEWSSDPNNSWYGDDEDMQAWADAYGLRSYQKNPQRPVTDIYAEISRKVREVFPHKFGNQKRTAPQSVESGERGSAKPEPAGEEAIPKEYKQVFHTMWRAGAWGTKTKKEAAKIYMKDLNSIGVTGEE